MILEPFELKGKVIKDCYYKNKEFDLVIEFEDGSKVIVGSGEYENDYTGEVLRYLPILIQKTL